MIAKKIILYLLACLVLVCVAYFIFIKFHSNFGLKPENLVTDITTATTTKLGSAFTQQTGKDDNTMYKTINQEIAGYKNDIDQSEGKDPEDVTMLKKIYYYRALGSYGVGVNTNDGGKTEMLTALNGLNSVYDQIDTVSASEGKNLSTLRLSLLKNLYDVVTGSPLGSLTASSTWANESDYKLFQTKYPTSSKLVFKLYLDNLFSKYNDHTDKMLVSVEMANAADILNLYPNPITPEYRKYLVGKLNDLNTKFATAHDSTIFTNIKLQRQVVPMFNYVYAIDILSRNDKEFNPKNVSDGYNNLFNLIDTTAAGSDDLAYVSEIKAQLNFLDFTFLQNKNKLNTQALGLIKIIENFPVVHKDNQTFLGFFSASIKSRSKFDKIFQSILKQNKNFNTFVAEYVSK